MLRVAGCIVVLCAAVSEAYYYLNVRVPPSILQSPVELSIYRSDGEIKLTCVASGTPEPEYEWLKDGRPLGNPSNVYRIAAGTILIKPLTSIDEGRYQCVASNVFGRALSRISLLQRAVLDSNSPNTPIFESPKIQEGQPYTLTCNPTKCIPRPTFSWAISSTMVDTTQAAVVLGKRLQIDDEGRLHFSYVTMADAQGGKLYKCNMYNPYLDLTMGGSYSRLNVVPVATIPLFAPTYLFSSPSPVVALEGRNVTLRCFFSGNPEPSLQWSKATGSLPIGRHQISNFNTELTIRDVQKSDEGDYYCRAANTQKQQDHLIQIHVQAMPVFRTPYERPHNVNVTDGDTVNITCSAYAEPAAKVVWLRNGVELNPARLPPKLRWLDSRRLQMSNVCKDCEDGTSDLSVIQCNASNAHGYAFADGYINILKKTEIVTRPQDLQRISTDTRPASFHCNATSDTSARPRVSWYRVRGEKDVGGAGDERLHNVTNKVLLSVNGSLTIMLGGENSSDWLAYRGAYKCRADNGYSSEEVVVQLTIDPVPPTPAPQKWGASVGDWWWVFVILAVLLLLLILLICCCVCLQRGKGDSYPVDQKERKNGNNPEKELADIGFRDYQRPEGGPHRGSSRESLESDMKMGSDDDEDELNEYGEIETGKFQDNGSFIHSYGTDRRRLPV